ncbi:hypothetical protein GCM10010315_34230 [Streptomyces luteosporeus]|uniref:Tn3 transposase DDE domain-containing protein n=1 Tax=Streptomyces luteosporeus TaxID=173856 RepID=A0ABP6G7T1_9ACTN
MRSWSLGRGTRGEDAEATGRVIESLTPTFNAFAPLGLLVIKQRLYTVPPHGSRSSGLRGSPLANFRYAGGRCAHSNVQYGMAIAILQGRKPGRVGPGDGAS